MEKRKTYAHIEPTYGTRYKPVTGLKTAIRLIREAVFPFENTVCGRMKTLNKKPLSRKKV